MMKSVFLHSFTLICIALLALSCEKENASSSETTTPTELIPELDQQDDLGFRTDDEFDYARCTSILNAVYKADGKLVFSDEDHFWNCTLCLEKQYDDYNDAYEAQYPNATAENLEVLDDINMFNEFTPYKNFEDGHNFASLRTKIESEVDAWLSSTPAESLDFDDDPEEKIPVDRKAARALLNEDGLATVGGETLSMEDWAELDIPDSCAFNKSRTVTFDENDTPILLNRKIKVKIRVFSKWNHSDLFGEITHYKKNGNGNFEKVRAELKIRVRGRAFNGDCVLMPQIWNNTDGYKNRKSVDVIDIHWFMWREAFVIPTHPQWNERKSMAHGFWKNDNNYFPVELIR